MRISLHMLRVAALVAPFTVFGAAVHMLLSLLDHGGRSQRAFEKFWFGVVLRLARVEVGVQGAHRARPGESYVIMPNHRSWFDIPVLHWALGDRDLRWIGKKEILRVPFFGWAFGLSRHIAIDRHNREEGIRAIRQAAEMSGQGVSIVIFPEGTRSPTEEMLPFKKGGFHLAAETGLAILPVAVAGTERVMRKREWTIRPGRVEVRICDPVPSAEYGTAGLPRLMQEVRERLRAALPQPTAKEVS